MMPMIKSPHGEGAAYAPLLLLTGLRPFASLAKQV
ncbi:Uncharacterised protein [Escherichia coli]|uniref:Uncharacterized protein n=1 Tax=Escherichia coli TaxID=562 RepID=A0A376UB00_ECOLX|nr:Uncharacterised protein [Escherichia coli]